MRRARVSTSSGTRTRREAPASAWAGVTQGNEMREPGAIRQLAGKARSYACAPTEAARSTRSSAAKSRTTGLNGGEGTADLSPPLLIEVLWGLRRRLRKTHGDPATGAS